MCFSKSHSYLKFWEYLLLVLQTFLKQFVKLRFNLRMQYLLNEILVTLPASTKHINAISVSFSGFIECESMNKSSNNTAKCRETLQNSTFLNKFRSHLIRLDRYSFWNRETKIN